jgi:hypothetical protein
VTLHRNRVDPALLAALEHQRDLVKALCPHADRLLERALWGDQLAKDMLTYLVEDVRRRDAVERAAAKQLADQDALSVDGRYPARMRLERLAELDDSHLRATLKRTGRWPNLQERKLWP